MSAWGAVAGAAADFASSAFGAHQQRGFDRKEAQKNRDWQERMSNTAHQRAADDLEKAGLNRILALSGPASTPGGAQASAKLPDSSRFMEAASAKAAIELSKAQARKTAAEAESAENDAYFSSVKRRQAEKVITPAEDVVDNFRDRYITPVLTTASDVENFSRNWMRGVKVVGDKVSEALPTDEAIQKIEEAIESSGDNVFKMFDQAYRRGLIKWEDLKDKIKHFPENIRKWAERRYKNEH